MKRFTKLSALFLSLILVIGSFASCSGKKEAVNTGEAYTYWTSVDTNTSQTISSYSELLMYQEMEKATGTKIKFIHPSKGSTGTEAFQILMASGDYPDMIEYNWASYTGGPDQAIDDGVIISLNEYMEDYAPNYYNYMEGEAGKKEGNRYKATAMSDKGNYYGFRSLNIGTYASFSGIYIRKDLLDKWGLDIPVTIADWDNVLATAKENGVKYPITGSEQLIDATKWGVDTFNLAWKVSNGFYLDDGKVKFGPFEKSYKDYVAKMAEWMKKGYLDIDFVTNGTNEIQGAICNGTSIAARGFVGGDLGSLIPAMKEREPGFNLAACPMPVLKEGEVPFMQSVQSASTDPTIAVTVQCGAQNEDRYKEAIQWCDYLYSEEGIALKIFGVEGDTYTIEKDEDGNKHYVYTDKVVKNFEEFGASNISAALYHFMLPANHPGFNQHPDYFEGYYELQQQKDAITVWNAEIEEARKHVFPSVSYTGEEATEKANIETAGKDNFIVAVHDIVFGKKDIDTYDDAVKALKKAGYDKLLEIAEAAYGRYLDKLEN